MTILLCKSCPQCGYSLILDLTILLNAIRKGNKLQQGMLELLMATASFVHILITDSNEGIQRVYNSTQTREVKSYWSSCQKAHIYIYIYLD